MISSKRFKLVQCIASTANISFTLGSSSGTPFIEAAGGTLPVGTSRDDLGSEIISPFWVLLSFNWIPDCAFLSFFSLFSEVSSPVPLFTQDEVQSFLVIDPQPDLVAFCCCTYPDHGPFEDEGGTFQDDSPFFVSSGVMTCRFHLF